MRDLYATFGRRFDHSAFLSAVKRNGLTGYSLAAAMNVRHPTAYNWINGDTVPKPVCIRRLCKVLTSTLDELAPRIPRELPDVAISYISKSRSVSAKMRYLKHKTA